MHEYDCKLDTIRTEQVARADLELVHASKEKELEVAAFEQLEKRYDRRLLEISHAVARNREEYEDAVLEALLKAFYNVAEFRVDPQFSTQEENDWR